MFLEQYFALLILTSTHPGEAGAGRFEPPPLLPLLLLLLLLLGS